MSKKQEKNAELNFVTVPSDIKEIQKRERLNIALAREQDQLNIQNAKERSQQFFDERDFLINGNKKKKRTLRSLFGLE